jgi:hypothetical protein
MANQANDALSETESKFYDLGEDTLELITNLIDKMALPFNLKIKFIGVTKQKQLIKLQKTSDVVSHLTGIDMFMFINEDYLITFDDTNAEILIYQELDRLQFDINKGTFKITKYQLQTNPGVLKKYGIDAVAQANQLVELLKEQKEDAAENDEENKRTIKRNTTFLN